MRCVAKRRRLPLLTQSPIQSGVSDGHLCRCRQGRARDNICKRSAQGHRRAHPPRPRATASTSRRCARSCVCASRTPTSAPRRKPFSKPTCRRWECCEAEQAMLSYAGLTRVSINLHKGSYEGDGLPGRRRTKATPSFGRLCPAMTMSLSAAMRSASRMTASPASQSPVR